MQENVVILANRFGKFTSYWNWCNFRHWSLSKM